MVWLKMIRIERKNILLNEFKIPEDYSLEAAPLVFYGSGQWEEMQDGHPKLQKLMDELHIKPFYISKDGDEYVEVE